MARQDGSDPPVDLLRIHQPPLAHRIFQTLQVSLQFGQHAEVDALLFLRASPASYQDEAVTPFLAALLHPPPRPRPGRCPGRRAWSASFHAALVPEIAGTRPGDQPVHIGLWTPESV